MTDTARLRELLAAATSGERLTYVVGMVERPNGEVVAQFEHDDLGLLYVEAVNALPKLLDVVEAARDHFDAVVADEPSGRELDWLHAALAALQKEE